MLNQNETVTCNNPISKLSLSGPLCKKKGKMFRFSKYLTKKNYISIGMKLEPSILELKNNYVITQFAEKNHNLFCK